MKQLETISCIFANDGVATIKELSNEPGAQIPQLTILIPPDVDRDILFPTQTLQLYSGSVRKLYDLLHGYYTK